MRSFNSFLLPFTAFYSKINWRKTNDINKKEYWHQPINCRITNDILPRIAKGEYYNLNPYIELKANSMCPKLHVSDTVDLTLKRNSHMTSTNSHTYFHKSSFLCSELPQTINPGYSIHWEWINLSIYDDRFTRMNCIHIIAVLGKIEKYLADI